MEGEVDLPFFGERGGTSCRSMRPNASSVDSTGQKGRLGLAAKLGGFPSLPKIDRVSSFSLPSPRAWPWTPRILTPRGSGFCGPDRCDATFISREAVVMIYLRVSLESTIQSSNNTGLSRTVYRLTYTEMANSPLFKNRLYIYLF